VEFYNTFRPIAGCFGHANSASGNRSRSHLCTFTKIHSAIGLLFGLAATAQAEQSFEAFSFLYLNLLTKIRVARSLYRQQTFPSAVSLSLAKNNLVRRIKIGSVAPYSLSPRLSLR
jgi:hypothetical protein